MSTALPAGEAPSGPASAVHADAKTASRGALRMALLACGLLYALAYIVADDVIAAAIYDGYSRLDQAISELSATEAPSKAFLTALMPLFTLLVIGFGLGVWKAAQGNGALRATSGLLIAQGLSFPVWLFFPMTSREDMAGGNTAANDVGHLVLTTLSVLFILAGMGFSAATLGKRFRIFSLAMVATALLSGVATARMSSGITAGDPTPGLGFVERISYGTWLLWMATLSIVLLRRERHAYAKPISCGATEP